MNWLRRNSFAATNSDRYPASPRGSRKKRRVSYLPLLEQLEEKTLPSGFSPTYTVHYEHGPGSGQLSNSSLPSTALTPAQLRNAYGINGISFLSNGSSITGNGAGETIAIVDAYDDPSIAADLTTFDTQFGIAAPPNFIKVGLNRNGVASTTSFPSANSGWAGEIELDVEYSHAIAPAATILLVEAYNSSDSALMAAVNYARNYSGVVAVSMSWGGGESSGEASDDSYFTTPSGHTGVTFFASAGDSSTIGYPAISSHVVAVGGTSLTLSSSGAYQSESAWGDGGGGLSQDISQPSYQNGLAISNGSATISANGMRAGPDVASDADPDTGVAVYGTYGFGGWAQVGGTSAGSPVWAGLMAIVDQGRAANGLSSMDGFTQTLPALYALPSSDFHDVTTGGNGIYSAGPGFDLVTGRGTPIANLLVPALAGVPGGTGSTIGSGGTGGTSPMPPTLTQAAQVTASTPTSVSLSALGTDPAGDASPAYSWNAVGAPTGAVSFSQGLTAGSTTAHFTQAGTYNLQVTITDPATGLSVTSQVSNYIVSQVLTSVTVSPGTATVAVSGTQQFTAAGLDQFGAVMATQPKFSWSVTSGTISSTGSYTASSTTGSATIQVTTGIGTPSGSANVTIINQTSPTTTLTAGPVSYYRRYALATLTVQLSPPPGSTVLPTGTVELFYEGYVLATANIQIVNGKATAQFTLEFTANGNYTFSAEYMGSTTSQESTTNSVTVTV